MPALSRSTTVRERSGSAVGSVTTLRSSDSVTAQSPSECEISSSTASLVGSAQVPQPTL
jgi:hypothetical protein